MSFDAEHFWKVRKHRQGKPMFDTAEEFLLEAIDYFQWVDTHPMREEVPFHYKGGRPSAQPAEDAALHPARARDLPWR